MIRLVLIFNTAGKPRLVKFYDRVDASRQAALLRRTADLILARPRDACNFLDPSSTPLSPSSDSLSSSSDPAHDTFDPLAPSRDDDPDSASSASASDDFPLAALLGTRGVPLKVVYRIYATLCFAMVVDASESELAILDLIQVFVESLDTALGPNVCELDLVFNFDRAHMLLAEVIQGGLVLETNVRNVVANYRAMLQHTKGGPKSGSTAGALLSATTALGGRGGVLA
ncbi:Sigma-adaptin 3A [Blastocladiella emersonii ATCC 22665]|nr:Sigma-adaptin 3A [Blastocladiella emersonii ATCC 22665]